MAEQREQPNVRRAARRQGKGPTLSDVASAAAVSLMTASRVVNGSGRVLPDTRRRVEAAIKALGYVPNIAARSLAGGRQTRLALLYENPSSAFLSEMLVGSLEQARRADALLLLETYDVSVGVPALLDQFLAHRIEGVLLPAPLCDDPALVEALSGAGIVVARVAATQPLPSAIAVGIDDEAAAHAMTRHLIDLGHRCIGFISGAAPFPMSARRLAGYRRALTEAGMAVEPDLLAFGDYTFRSGMDAAETLLATRERATAIFASNDDMAAGTIATMHRHRLEVPRDISVCGFDDTAMARSIWPELTTIRQPVAAMAGEATRLLVEHLRGGHSPARDPLPDVRLSFEIVERASTQPPVA